MDLEDNHIRTASCVEVVDGDTFLADVVTLKAGTTEQRLRVKIRVHQFNAQELSEAEGPHMRDVFAARLHVARRIRLKTYYMSHDRIVCDVWLDGVLFAGELHAALRSFRDRPSS